MAKKKLVVLTGAGVSAESGLKTFRDSDGLWEGYDVTEVATPRGWKKNPGLVLEFYNQRRKNVADAKPNAAHYGLAELENDFDVTIITQNMKEPVQQIFFTCMEKFSRCGVKEMNRWFMK
jgi:NAD-dependent deacetylase